MQILAPTEQDIRQMIAARVHLGDTNADHRMMHYVHSRSASQNHVFNLGKTWEKIMLAARAIATIQNPQDVMVISGKAQGQRAVLKFGYYTGAQAIAGRFSPGALTNQNQSSFREPRILICTDPRVDHQAISEASYVNIPVIAFVTSDNPLRYIDIAIPCNNRGTASIGLMLWFLAREVLRLRGTLARTEPWDVMPDLFFYRDQEEAIKEEPTQVVEAAQQDYDQIQASGMDQADWDQTGTIVGQAVANQNLGFAANEDWNATAEDWNKPPAGVTPATQDWNAAGAQAWNA